jgi:hypothetical protein
VLVAQEVPREGLGRELLADERGQRVQAPEDRAARPRREAREVHGHGVLVGR